MVISLFLRVGKAGSEMSITCIIVRLIFAGFLVKTQTSSSELSKLMCFSVRIFIRMLGSLSTMPRPYVCQLKVRYVAITFLTFR